MTRALVCSAACIVILAAPGPATPAASRPAVDQTSPDPESAVPRITVAELKKALAADRVVVLDVRDQGSYESGHIPGARLVPLGDIQKHVAALKKIGKPIVAYCA